MGAIVTVPSGKRSSPSRAELAEMARRMAVEMLNGTTTPAEQAEIVKTMRLQTELEVFSDDQLLHIVRMGVVCGTDSPETVPADVLARMEIKPPRWIVDDLIPAGLTILAGKPKVGKSFAALGLALAVAQGGMVFDAREAERGEVLYIGLEDTLYTLKANQARLTGSAAKGPEGLTFNTIWPQFSNAKNDPGDGIAHIKDHLIKYPDTSMIVIDTLEKIRPPQGRSSTNAYRDDVKFLERIKYVADSEGVAILLLHHERKAKSEDPMDLVSGTFGIAGTADTILVLQRKRGERTAKLHVMSRMMEDGEIEMHFDRESLRWSMGEKWTLAQAKTVRGKVLDYVEKHPGCRLSEITTAIREKNDTIKKTLLRLVAFGDVERRGSRGSYTYIAPDLVSQMGGGSEPPF